MDRRDEERFAPLKKKLSLPLLLGVLLTVVLICSLLYNVNFSQLKSSLSNLSVIHLILAAFCALTSIIMRGFRWGLIVEQLGKRSYGLAMHMTHVSLLLNATLPLRTGDIYKVVFIGRSGILPYHKSLIALVFERVLDVLVIYGLYVVSIFMLGKANRSYVDLFGAHVSMDFITHAFDSLALLIACAITVFICLQFGWVKKVLIAAYRHSGGLAHKWLRKLYVIHEFFVGAFHQIRSPLSLALIIILSLLHWLLFALSLYIVSLGFKGVNLDFIHAIFVATVGAIVIQFPSIPGGWGLFETGGVIAILSYSDLDVSVALSVALMAHLSYFIPTIIIGLFSLVFMLVNPELNKMGNSPPDNGA